jgi:hypothetical protein
MRKTFDLIFLVLLCALLVSALVLWLTRKTETNESIEEHRYLKTFASVQMDWQNLKTAAKRAFAFRFSEAKDLSQSFWKRSFQANLEAACSDQFVGRINFLRAERWIERGIIWMAYLPFDDSALPAGGDDRIMVLRDSDVLMWRPATFDVKVRDAIDERIANYEQLMTQHPQINFFVLCVEQISTSNYHPAASFFPQFDDHLAIQYFEEHKPQRIVFSSFRLESFQEHQQYFFRTDHHWNGRGAWLGYQQVYQMLKPFYPEIGPMLVAESFAVLPVKFCGSFSRATLYPCQPDLFDYPVVKLPQYQTYVDGALVKIGDPEKLANASSLTNPYEDIYGKFWGMDQPLVWYHYENGSQRDLLLIGDSFSNPIDRLIAAHYRNTYVVDLRLYEDFSLTSFLSQYPVDDVLILGSQAVFSTRQWYIHP